MQNLRTLVIALLVIYVSGQNGIAQDFDNVTAQKLAQFIDQELAAQWKIQHLVPSNRCVDHEFLRRACLDIVGVIPSENTVARFLGDTNRDKRAALVEGLLETDAYARFAAVSWSNLLVGRGQQAEALTNARFRDWLHNQFKSGKGQFKSGKGQFKSGKGFDDITRQLLTAKGSVLQNPAVTWTIHHDTKPENLSGAASRVFLGAQIQCAQCHDHPFEPRSQEDFYGMAAFFARTTERRVLLARSVSEATTGEIRLGGVPAGKIIAPRFMDGSVPTAARSSRRDLLAKWIIDPKNKQFARTIANRIWARMIGRGLVDPVDDFNRDNTPDYPRVLERLADGFIASGYDTKFLVNTIARTRAYQLSTRPSRNNKNDQRYFSKARLRRLNPEQLVASIVMSTGLGDKVKTWDNPLFQLIIQVVLNDFIFVFDNMDEVREVSEFRGTIAQALMMMNSKHITNTTDLNFLSPLMRKLTKCPTVKDKIDLLFRTTVSRHPTSSELRRFSQYFRGVNRASDQIEVCEDIYWALLNCNEFNFNY